jgi:hypothetical protein
VTWHDSVTTSVGGDAALERGREETTSVELTRILIDQKIKKIYTVDLAVINGWWRFKVMIS